MHYLIKDIEDATSPPDATTLNVIDGNAFFYMIKSIQSTFQGVGEQIFTMIPKASVAIFSTDMYRPDSVKLQVRLRRGVGHKKLVSGQNTKYFKSFLSNDDNKRQLINMLLDVWTQDRFADKLQLGVEE